jgi:hypothetical protein
MFMSVVEVKRRKTFQQGLLARIPVLLDGKVVARLWIGRSVLLEVPPGEHKIQVRSGWSKSQELIFSAKADERLLFECGPVGNLVSGPYQLVTGSAWVEIHQVSGAAGGY